MPRCTAPWLTPATLSLSLMPSITSDYANVRVCLLGVNTGFHEGQKLCLANKTKLLLSPSPSPFFSPAPGQYLKWMERARAEMIGIKTLAKMRDGGKGIGAAIHKVRLTYKEGARFGDRVHISTVGSKQSDFRLAFSHEVRRVPPMDEGEGLGSPELMRDLGSRGTLLVSGEVEMVFLDKGGAGALVKVPDTLSL